MKIIKILYLFWIIVTTTIPFLLGFVIQIIYRGIKCGFEAGDTADAWAGKD